MKSPGIILALGIMTVAVYSQGNKLPTDLVSKDAAIVKAGSGYAFTEGPSSDAQGRVFFTDQPNDRIYVWDEHLGISLFLQGSQRSNGTFIGKDGFLYTCADLYNRLIKISPEGNIETVYDKGINNMHFNGPNDLWMDGNGGIYFTDPFYQRDYWNKGHSRQLDGQGVYYLKSSGELVKVIDDLKQPNGIVGTPDGKYLYVADIGAGKTWRYAIRHDGTLSEKIGFAPVGSDGMTLDNQGNLYLTYGKIYIYSSRGEKAGEIELPENPSNVCFGGRKKDILFVTARTSVYTISMKVRGVE